MALLRQEGWTRWPTEVPSNPYHSMILWFCEWQSWYQAISVEEGLTSVHALLAILYFSLLPSTCSPCSPSSLFTSSLPSMYRIKSVLINEIKCFWNMPEYSYSVTLTIKANLAQVSIWTCICTLMFLSFKFATRNISCLSKVLT